MVSDPTGLSGAETGGVVAAVVALALAGQKGVEAWWRSRRADRTEDAALAERLTGTLIARLTAVEQQLDAQATRARVAIEEVEQRYQRRLDALEGEYEQLRQRLVVVETELAQERRLRIEAEAERRVAERDLDYWRERAQRGPDAADRRTGEQDG